MGDNLWPSPLSRPRWISWAWSSVKPWARLAFRVVKLQITINSKGRTRTAAESPRATNAGLTSCSPIKDSLNKIQTRDHPPLQPNGLNKECALWTKYGKDRRFSRLDHLGNHFFKCCCCVCVYKEIHLYKDYPLQSRLYFKHDPLSPE